MAPCFSPIWTQHSVNKHGKGPYRTKVPEAGGIHTSLYTQGNLGPVTEESRSSPSHPTATGPELELGACLELHLKRPGEMMLE